MRVLVVDDDRSLAAGLRVGLQAEGFAVDVAHNGTDGLWRAREAAYDVILLDIMLPHLSGYQVCEALRADEIWTPVIMLTAKNGEYDEIDGLDLGADDYITKPFAFSVLVARVRAAIRRGAARRPVVLRAGTLRLNPGTHEAFRGDEPIDLTAREAAVLEFLLRHRGDIVSKQQILDHVWDSDFDGDPNIVEVYIRLLRNKIDRPFGCQTITTVRGAGYRLVADSD